MQFLNHNQNILLNNKYFLMNYNRYTDFLKCLNFIYGQSDTFNLIRLNFIFLESSMWEKLYFKFAYFNFNNSKLNVLFFNLKKKILILKTSLNARIINKKITLKSSSNFVLKFNLYGHFNTSFSNSIIFLFKAINVFFLQRKTSFLILKHLHTIFTYKFFFHPKTRLSNKSGTLNFKNAKLKKLLTYNSWLI